MNILSGNNMGSCIERRLLIMDISKKIKQKYYCKYITLLFLLILYVALFGIIITQFVRKDLFLIFYIFFIIDFIISVFLTNIYYKLFKLPKIENINILIMYIDFFKPEISDLLYTETVTWFSHLIKDAYIKPNECKTTEFSNYINRLYLILRPNDLGLCEATKRKSSFISLCKKIIDKESIDEDITNFKNKPCEKYHYINIVHDKNIIIYALFLPIHTFACFLITKGSCSTFNAYIFFGNLLLYIPTDILAILIYKGILKNTQS